MSDQQPHRDIFTAIADFAGHVPVSETLRATRTAVEIAATVTQQAHTLLALQRENARLGERLISATAEADRQRERADRLEARADALRRAIRELVETGS